MSGALDRDAQMIFSREVQRCDNISCIPCFDGVDAWLCGPGIDPASRLRETKIIADKVWMSDLLEELLMLE